MHTNGRMVVRQCSFETPTHAKAVTLLAASPTTAKGERPRDIWRKQFQNEDATRDPSNKRDGDKVGGGKEEEERRPPQRIEGLGDQAYWVPNAVGSALYVLQGNQAALGHLAQFDFDWSSSNSCLP